MTHTFRRRPGLVVNGGEATDDRPKGLTSATTGDTAIIVERRPLIRDCLVQSIRETTGFDFLATATLEECLWLAKDRTPFLVLISVVGGLENDDNQRMIREATQNFPETPILILADRDSRNPVLNVREARPCGYISTGMPLDVAIAAIRVVHSGGTPPISSVHAQLNSETPQPKPEPAPSNLSGMFTVRQAAVVDALRKGKANKIIAYELKMKESTVKVHVRNIMKRLNAKNRTEVSYIAAQLETGSPLLPEKFRRFVHDYSGEIRVSGKGLPS